MAKVGAEPIRVVLDANIIVSASRFGGTPDAVMDLGRGEKLSVYISSFILSEVTRVLAGPKFGWERIQIEESLEGLRQWIIIVEPSIAVQGVVRDANDDPILACCLEANADYLVTGDNDLLALGAFRGTQIVNAAAFLEIYNEAFPA